MSSLTVSELGCSGVMPSEDGDDNNISNETIWNMFVLSNNI